MASTLTIRQHEREELELIVEFEVDAAHREQVKFSSLSTAKNTYVTEGRAVDISSGGMGLVCRHFVPRMCEGTVRVFEPHPRGTDVDGSPIHDLAFEHRVKVRRVHMDTHEPSYALGIAFIDPGPDLPERLEELRHRVQASMRRRFAELEAEGL